VWSPADSWPWVEVTVCDKWSSVLWHRINYRCKSYIA
jgi:hypothetical protein